MSPKVDIDPEHAVALATRHTLADKIRYACERVHPPTTHEVRQWLETYGVTTARGYASSVIDTWRKENELGDTGDLVAMSPELLAELDALRADTTDEPLTPVDTTPSVEDVAASTADTQVFARVPTEQPTGAEPEPRADDRTSTGTGAALDTGDAPAAEVTPEVIEATTPTQDAPDTVETPAGATTPEAVVTSTTTTPDTVEHAETVEVPASADAPKAVETVEAATADDARVETAEPESGVRTRTAVVVADPPGALDVVTARSERVDPPAQHSEAPMQMPMTRVPRALSWSAGMAWIVVLIAAMGISWWSLFEYARGFSIPTPLAAVVSLVFDASALIVAGLAHRYALSPYSGAGPRFALLALLAGSVYLNWEHAAGKGYGVEASIMFAAPAAVGILLFELHIGWHSRSERRARGRVARSLPVIGAWGWFLHPMQSVTTLWRVTHARGRVVRDAELTSIERS